MQKQTISHSDWLNGCIRNRHQSFLSLLSGFCGSGVDR